jgi:TPR repeat protein
MLTNDDGILEHKSFASDDFKLSTHQGNASAQFFYGVMLAKGEDVSMNQLLGCHYYKLSDD